MLEHLIETYLPNIIHFLEIIGIIIITVGSIRSFIYFLIQFFNPKKVYNLRTELGAALALGLEYKMGAEILKTVLIRDISEIWVLGAIILLRALLSLLLHFEMKAEAQDVAVVQQKIDAKHSALDLIRRKQEVCGPEGTLEDCVEKHQKES